jgi:hypothetical protein
MHVLLALSRHPIQMSFRQNYCLVAGSIYALASTMLVVLGGCGGCMRCVVCCIALPSAWLNTMGGGESTACWAPHIRTRP